MVPFLREPVSFPTGRQRNSLGMRMEVRTVRLNRLSIQFEKMKTTGAKNTVDEVETETSGRVASHARECGGDISQARNGGAGCVQELFGDAAAKEPERLAVTSSRGSLTYGELN